MFIYRVAHVIISNYLKVAYRHKVFGVEHVIAAKTGSIIAANHVSFLDPPLIGASIPFPVYYLARSSLFRGKFMNFLLRTLGAVPLTQQIDHEAFRKIGRGFTVVIFPEGTRSKEGTLKPFNLGVALLAKTLECPVIPAYIDGAFEAWPPSRKFPHFTGKTLVAFGPPCYLKDFKTGSKREQYQAFTAALEQEVAGLKTKYSESS